MQKVYTIIDTAENQATARFNHAVAEAKAHTGGGEAGGSAHLAFDLGQLGRVGTEAEHLLRPISRVQPASADKPFHPCFHDTTMPTQRTHSPNDHR